MAGYKQQEWINGGGSIGGKRAYVRKNLSLRETATEQFPHVVIVNLAYEDLSPEGLPASGVELSNMDETEESIADRMSDVFGALFGLIVTSDGTRDLFFFLPMPPGDDAIQDAIDDATPSVDYDFSVHDDPLWRPYFRFLPENGSSPEI